MAFELALAPFMFPIAAGYAVLCHYHRQVSRYIPIAIPMNEYSTTSYTVRAEGGALHPRYGVYNEADKLCFTFEGSRLSKGLFNFVRHDHISGERFPVGTVSVGVWSKFHIYQPHGLRLADKLSLSAAGDHKVQHQSDALDSYRIVKISDNCVYQWSKRGKAMERVYNLGQKDSEVHERMATVDILSDDKGYRITLDETKVSVTMALMTSMISFLDHWNTILGIGGVYLPVKHEELPWRRV